nr:MAG TPA: hypothetical protein [Caudoviricetes sp.]
MRLFRCFIHVCVYNLSHIRQTSLHQQRRQR